MNSTSLPHVRDRKSLGGVLWRQMMLFAGVALVACFAVAFGLGAMFGACPERRTTGDHMRLLPTSR